MRILIIRTSALGDIVHCLPTLTALRRRYPEARIGWVVERAMAPLLEGHPDLDDLLVVATRAWRRNPFSGTTLRELRSLRSQLTAFAPDVALDLMGNHKGALLAHLSGAPRRIGLGRRQRREPTSALWINEAVPETAHGTPAHGTAPHAAAQHAVDRALAIAAALGIDQRPADFGGERLAEEIPADLPREPYVVLFPATGWANKSYPLAAFGEAARGINRSTGLQIRVAPGPGEEESARRLATAAGGTARALPVLPIPALIAVLRRARLAAGGDTGPIHLAHALGTPVVCIMGPTDPERNGPYGALEQAIYERLPCSFCYKRYDEAKPCLLSIPPKRLQDKALELLGAS